MKAPFQNRKSGGFTLIELLVVIAIILTLAGISMVVVNGAQEKGKQTTARSDINGLQVAIENYMMDTGRLPVAWTNKELAKHSRKDGQIYVTTALDDDSRIMSILTNYMDRDDEDRKLNPKKTAYYSSTQTDLEGTAGLYFESRGRVGLMDPWEHPYYIIINANPDDRSPRIQVGSRLVTKNVAVYSVGRDGEGSTEDGQINVPEATEDNVKSWGGK